VNGASYPLLAALLLTAAPAAAREIALGWETNLNWDSNPQRLVRDEEADVSLYGGPDLTLRERGRRVDYSLRYRPQYEQFLRETSINGFEHFGRAAVRWNVSPRTQLHFDQDLSRTRSFNSTFLDPVPGIDPVGSAAELQIRRRAVLRSTSQLRASRVLSPRWSLEGTLDGQVFEFEDERRASAFSARGSAQALRVLTPRTVVGLGAGVTRQDFDDTDRSVGQGTTFFEGFGVFRYQLSPVFSLSFSGGPAWSRPDDIEDEQFAPRQGVGQDLSGVTRLVDPTRCLAAFQPQGLPAGTFSRSACVSQQGLSPALSPLIPGVVIDPRLVRFSAVDLYNDQGEPDGSLSFFGRAAIERRWQQWFTSLSYQRRANASSGLDASTNLDLVTAQLAWVPDRRRWRVDLRGIWTRQEAASEQAQYDFLLADVPTTVYVDSAGRIFEQPVAGATAVPNASRVVGVRTIGFVDSGVEITSYLLDLRVTRRMSENLVLLASAGWWQQEVTGDFREAREVESLRFQVGATWSFDPIEF
jgi:hypothetical protein